MRALVAPTLAPANFGRLLVEMGDLDPVYTAARGVLDVSSEAGRAWLEAYWLFYSPGLACYLADRVEAGEGWDPFIVVAVNETPSPLGKRWPRGAERRHFRASRGRALRATAGLATRYPEGPGGMVRRLATLPPEAAKIMRFVRGHEEFGPWIAFKAADMVERLGILPVRFDSTAFLRFFNTPVAGARLLRYYDRGDPFEEEGEAVEWAVEYLLGRLGEMMAPPTEDRPLGIQEAETILCKWKSYSGGTYLLGQDTEALVRGLAEWAPVSPTAERMLAAAELLPLAPGRFQAELF